MVEESPKLPLPGLVATLKRKLQGYWNYYGVIGNSEQTSSFAYYAKRLVYKWLNRRSQRKSFTWTSFAEAWVRWKMPSPRVIEKPLPYRPRQNQYQEVNNLQPIRVQS